MGIHTRHQEQQQQPQQQRQPSGAVGVAAQTAQKHALTGGERSQRPQKSARTASLLSSTTASVIDHHRYTSPISPSTTVQSPSVGGGGGVASTSASLLPTTSPSFGDDNGSQHGHDGSYDLPSIYPAGSTATPLSHASHHSPVAPYDQPSRVNDREHTRRQQAAASLIDLHPPHPPHPPAEAGPSFAFGVHQQLPLPYFGLDTQQLQLDNVATNGSLAVTDAAGGSLALPNFDLGGLEWIFEALEESHTSSRADPGGNGLGSPALMASNLGQHEQLQQLHQQQQQAKVAASAAAAAEQRNNDGAAREEGGEWPQDYRPVSSSLPLFELTQLKLDGFSEDVFSGGVNAPSTSSSSNTSGPSVTILDLANSSSLGSVVPPHCVVSQETRQRLLEFLRHSCKHPWSRYQLSADASQFLTVPQLQTLVHLFFERFDTHLPFLHKPTFRTDRIPSMLLLVIITIGLVFHSTAAGAGASSNGSNRLAVALSEVARISVVSAVESDLQGFMHMFVTQSWLLQQLFGLGCGDKKLFQLAERNRTGIATFVRRLGLLRIRHSSTTGFSPRTQSRSGYQTPANTAEAAAEKLSLDQRWRSWIEIECRVRLGWAVYMYDQGYPMCFDLPPVLVYSEVASQLPCDEALWSASTAQEWEKIMGQLHASHPAPEQQDDEEGGMEGGATTLSDRTSDFLNTLQSFLQNKSTAVRINKFGAVILATTFYRLMWDHSKQELLLGWSTSQPIEEGGSLGSRASASLSMLVNATGTGSLFQPSSSDAMISDLTLIKMLSDLHFGFPPRLFDELKDAAGRFGFQTEGHREAHSWLGRFFANATHKGCIERGVRSAVHIYQVSAAKVGASGGRNDQGLSHVTAVFHSALLLWAYLSFHSQSTAVSWGKGGRGEELESVLGVGIGEMLSRFAGLLDSFPWVLARSFRAVLQRLVLLDGAA